jgi:hypothetical protein
LTELARRFILDHGVPVKRSHMGMKPYAAPTIETIGTLHELTQVSTNKYETKTPDGVLLHPPTGPVIPLSS